jgi:hypothetical protein
MVAPMETWPSAAMTTESPRRTQITVVERTRRPPAKSSGWARLGDAMVAIFTWADDFTEREEDGLMSNFQYIVSRLLTHEPESCLR